ncbi:hypothetical protein C8Q74DRAFT_1051956 [Fomes fomentarius]|nr:hypothetical protein C8Q74DRAFT_1051956 [Fomes fomentarius]
MATSTELSSPTDSPGPIERFVFDTLPSPRTCTPATFNWTYLGVAHSFSFTISQQIAPHTDRTGATRRAISDLTIANNLQATDETWTWTSVNVTQGWYVLEASGDTWRAISTEFFVTNGTDVSCLYPTQLPLVSTTKISLSMTPPSPGPTSADVPKTPSAAPSTTHLPVGTTGGIIGGVIGFAVLMIIAYIFTRRWRSANRNCRPSTDALSPAPRRRWDPLSSRASASRSFVVDEKFASTYTTGDASCRRSLEPNRRPPCASLLHPFTEASPRTAQASEQPLRLDMPDIPPDPVITLGSVDPVLHIPKVRTSRSVSSIGTLNMDTPTTHISAYSSYCLSTTSSMGRSDDSPAPSSTTSHMYLSGSGMRY